MMKKLIITVLLVNNINALPSVCTPIDTNPATINSLISTGEGALGIMQGLITRIGTNAVPGLCVPVEPVDPQQLALCSSLIAAYTASVATISQPCTIDMSLEPTYLANPFDPCKFTVSGMLGDGIYCPLTSFKPN